MAESPAPEEIDEEVLKVKNTYPNMPVKNTYPNISIKNTYTNISDLPRRYNKK